MPRRVAVIGAALSDVVSLRIHVVDYRPERAEAVAGPFQDFFSPATTWIGVAALADPRFLLEVEATAVFD